MKPLFRCELEYFPSPHLSQIYDGFQKLKKAGIIDLSIRTATGNSTKPLLTVIVDGTHKVIYDTLDGLNWVDNISTDENLKHYKNTIQADFYFKRSYNQAVASNAPANCKVYPLGLNYSFTPEGSFPMSIKEMLVDIAKNNFIVSKFYTKYSFVSSDFECPPNLSREGGVLFLARLWNPDDVKEEQLKTEREAINKNRIASIRACQKEFGARFTGGLQDDSFSRLHAKDLIVPFSLTRKESFLKAIKDHDVCIATTGLHDSIGWKFGEYVAASRGIVSESLCYEIPGDFKEGKNYLTFTDENALVEKTRTLLADKDALSTMMNNNFQYYNNFLRPDKLVLNTLLQIKESIERL